MRNIRSLALSPQCKCEVALSESHSDGQEKLDTTGLCIGATSHKTSIHFSESHRLHYLLCKIPHLLEHFKVIVGGVGASARHLRFRSHAMSFPKQIPQAATEPSSLSATIHPNIALPNCAAAAALNLGFFQRAKMGKPKA